ncbi:hypothetical protein F0562_012960 [Nyssa sinensis]|uniref:Uncharacterized protein n=1 Tax=Nyssa sinensis TaxID=561372 RepID=A0A5J4ZYZ0_9ASTE|nr:hypothetical protein F0562_012960 [Nyssa sinensis]
MAATRATTNMIVMEIFLPSLSFGSVRLFHISLPKFGGTPNLYLPWNQLQPRPVERRRQRGCLRFSNSCSRPMRELLPPATNLFLKSPSEKNRINKDGVIVISSTKTRTQKLTSAHKSFLPSVCLCVAKAIVFMLLLILQG